MKWLDLPRWIANLIFLQTVFSTPVLCFHNLKRPPVKLKEVIPGDYDNFQTPDINEEPVDVSVKIEILNIRSVNVAEMSFIADVFLHETWQDIRLRYPTNLSLGRISLNPEWEKHIWTPDVYFHNAVEGKVLNTIIPYTYLWLRNDSTVDFGARLSLEFSCDMLLHNFPHDTQTCEIIMKSLTHTPAEMKLHWKDLNAISEGDVIVLPQFELATPKRSHCNESVEFLKHKKLEKFACIRGVIQLSRRSGYYFINVYIPSMLIVFMSMLTFWIPVDAVPGRVTLGVTSLLTIITKQYQTSIPSVSYIVAINVWLALCIGFVFCGLLEYSAVVALLSHQKRLAENTDKNSPRGDNRGDNDTQRRPRGVSDMPKKKLENIDVYNIDRVCRVAFPLTFCFMCIIYFSIYVE